jgi:hypothetical protein
MKTVLSTDYRQVLAESFDILVDPKPRYPLKPAIALKVDPIDGESFIMPIDFGTAKELAAAILEQLLFHAPHLFAECV